MKILLVTTKHSIFDQVVRKTFEDLGCSVVSVDYRDNPVLMPGVFIHKAVKKLPSFIKKPLIARAQSAVDFSILKLAEKLKPDLIFVLKAKEINLDTLDALRKIAKTANWYPETFDHWETIQRIAPHYDFFFNYDSEVVRRLKDLGIQGARYLPFCSWISPEESVPEISNRKYNISFVGSFMPVRYTQRETILSQVKDLGLHIWGNKAWTKTELKDCYHGRPSNEEMVQIYRDSKIVVNIDLMQGIDGTGVNLRPFEITSAGALLLNHDDRKDIFNLFEEDKDFISFEGPDDVRAKVEYYLNHEQERAAIAKAGFEKARSHHTYHARMKEALGIISGHQL